MKNCSFAKSKTHKNTAPANIMVNEIACFHVKLYEKNRRFLKAVYENSEYI